MNHKQFKQQQSIIDGWISETQKAYNIEDVSDSHIVAYLAQKQMGVHFNDANKNLIIDTWNDGYNGVFGTADNYYNIKFEEQ